MKQITALATLALAGCLNIPLNQEEATAEFRKFRGRPVSDLAGRLNDQTIENPGRERLEFKQTGNRYAWKFTSWHFTSVGVRVPSACWVWAVTDDSKIIRSIDLDGNIGGCSWMARRAGNLK